MASLNRQAILALSLALPLGTRAQDVRHPRSEYFVRQIRTSAILRFELPKGPSRTYGAVVEGLRTRATRAPVTVQYGFSKDKQPHVLGFVADVDVDEMGNTYVLDDRLNVVNVFDRHGNLRYKLGRSGRGPGEFTEPTAIALSATNALYVSDITRRLNIYPQKGHAHDAGKSESTEIPIDDLCTIGGHIIAHSRTLRRNELIYVMDDRGRVLRSFGELYRSPNVLVNMEIARGKVACAPNEKLVFYGPSAVVPELRGYALDGRLKWVTSIEGYRSTDVSQPKGRPQNVKVSVPAQGYHQLFSALYDGAGSFIVQVGFVSYATARKRLGYDRLYTFVVSASDGAGELLGDAIPRIGAIRGTRVWFIHNEPYSFVEVRDVAEGT